MKLCGNQKVKLNIIIDIILFLLLGLIAGIGFLLKYVLIHGSERNIIYGNDIDLLFLGMDRHEWGYVHFVLSIAFIGFLVLHIIFHWNMIICMLQRLFVLKKIRYLVVSFFIVIFVLFFVFPFIVRPDIVQKDAYFRNFKHQSNQKMSEETDEVQYNDKKHHQHHDDDFHQYEINGQMTLQSVADAYDVSLDLLTNEVNIPVSEKDIKLGKLKKNYGFTMTDIARAIDKIKNR